MSWHEMTEELDLYLDDKHFTSSGTLGRVGPQQPLPELWPGDRLYNLTRAWMTETWGGGDSYDPVPIRVRDPWEFLLKASRDFGGDKESKLIDWADCLLALRADAGRLAEAVPKPTATPKRLLTGWREIAEALEMRHPERDKIKSLNKRYNGPITVAGQGSQPMVERNLLIEWWNRLAALQEELANQREGRNLSAESQHNFGRDGKVAPEVGGSVKKRRKDKRA